MGGDSAVLSCVEVNESLALIDSLEPTELPVAVGELSDQLPFWVIEVKVLKAAAFALPDK
jgi:hypothetical protein